MNNENVKKDIDKYAKLSALKDSDGGKILIETLKSDISSAIDALTGMYRNSSHIELISKIAEIEAKMSIYKVLIRSTKNKKLAMDFLEEEQV